MSATTIIGPLWTGWGFRNRSIASQKMNPAITTSETALTSAASVFGEAFKRDGVEFLLGGPAKFDDLVGWLQTLVVREVLSVGRDGDLRGGDSYVFRHGLLREAAYAMLTDADRASGHRLAGEWLERTGAPPRRWRWRITSSAVPSRSERLPGSLGQLN